MGRLYDRIAAALLWIAAFAFATGVFLSMTLLLRSLPPTAPVAVGLVTIERYSKLKDYLGAALFLLMVPPLAVWLQRVGERLLERERRRFGWRRTSRDMPVAMLFTLPFVLSPLFYLTTGKVGWILLLPAALAWAGVWALYAFDSNLWFRQLIRRELHPYHVLLFCEGLSWVVFRYVVTWRRIAHYPTLFLEAVFAALFVALFWGVAVFIARLAQLSFGRSSEEVFRRIATAGLPLFFLPLLAILFVPTPRPAAAIVIALLIGVLLAMRLRAPLSPGRAWNLA